MQPPHTCPTYISSCTSSTNTTTTTSSSQSSLTSTYSLTLTTTPTPTFSTPSIATLTIASSSATSSPTPVTDAVTSTPNAGAIAGGVIGGVVGVVCIVLGVLLYLRARKRKHTAPSAEFMNSLRAGTTPVLRLDSGIEYTSALPEKGSYSSVPLPFRQDSYYPSPPTQNMNFPEAMMLTNIPSRPSMEKPVHPNRYSDHPVHDSYTTKAHHASTSIGSRRELLSSDAEIVPSDLPPRQHSALAQNALDFSSRFSMDEQPSQPLSATLQDPLQDVTGRQSPPRVSSPSLQPLRRQQTP